MAEFGNWGKLGGKFFTGMRDVHGPKTPRMIVKNRQKFLVF